MDRDRASMDRHYDYEDRILSIPIELWDHYVTNEVVAGQVKRWAWSQESVDRLYIRIIDALCDHNHLLGNALRKRIENESPVIQVVVVRPTPE